MAYRLFIDWDDDGYASPSADITADVEAFRVRYGLIADADPYQLVNAPADGVIGLLNPGRRYSADSRQTSIGTVSLLQEHACKILNPLDRVEWEGIAGPPVIAPQERFARGEVELFGKLRDAYNAQRSESVSSVSALADVIGGLVRSVTGAAPQGNILNVGQTIANVVFVGPTVDYIDSLALYAGGVAFENAAGGLHFVSLGAAASRPATVQVLPARVKLLADRTLSYRRIPLLRNVSVLRQVDLYESPTQTLAAPLALTLPSDGRSYSYVTTTGVQGALSVNWPSSASLQAQLPALVSVTIQRSGADQH